MQKLARWPQVTSSVLGVALLSISPSSAKTVLLHLDLQPQYASQLCWAAVDVIAVNSFFTGACSSDATPGRTSQVMQATQNQIKNGIGGTPVAVLDDCKSDIQDCNHRGVPSLTGLQFDPAPSDGLTWEQAKQQLNGGHPFVFSWIYSADETNQDQDRDGEHFLIAIGYKEESGKKLLTIWDPLPVPEPVPHAAPVCGAANVSFSRRTHTRSIPFDTYKNPVNDMGVDAVHGRDMINLAVAPSSHSQSDAETRPSLLSWSQIPASTIATTRSSFASRVSLPSSSERRSVRASPEPSDSAGTPDNPAPIEGIPFPIVALSLAELRTNRANLGELLKQKRAAFLYPLESDGTVVDSYLKILRGGTQVRGGDSNTEVTRLLVEARDRYARKHNLNVRNFYMVSVPGRAAFFAGIGEGSHAMLLPASTDPSINAVAGKAVPAQKQLGLLVAAIERDDRGRVQPPRRPTR